MRHYLVDFENVRSHGIDHINTLSAEDHVKIFYSTNSNNIPISLHRKIVASPAKVDFVAVESGTKNALDFQLATCLGYLWQKTKMLILKCILSPKTKDSHASSLTGESETIAFTRSLIFREKKKKRNSSIQSGNR